MSQRIVRTGVDLTPDPLRPSAWPIYKNSAENATENKAVVKEPYPRWRPNAELALVSGTPVVAGLYLPINTVVSGISFFITAAEATPANRTHLWVALLNSANKVIARSVDYTSSANTPMGSATRRGLLLTTPYETTETGLFYAMLCEVMSSTAPLKVGNATVFGGINEAPPALCGTGPAGQTEPPALAATLALTAAANYPHLSFV